MANINKDTTYFLETLVLDSNGDPITSLSVSYKVIRSLDNTLLDSGSMSHIGDGVYQDSYLFASDGQYRILYITPTQYTNDIETVIVGEVSNTEIYDIVRKTLGLVQSNHRFTNQIYNSSKCLTSGVITIYPTATDTNNQTNAIASYQITASYDGENKLVDYKVTEI